MNGVVWFAEIIPLLPVERRGCTGINDATPEVLQPRYGMCLKCLHDPEV